MADGSGRGSVNPAASSSRSIILDTPLFLGPAGPQLCRRSLGTSWRILLIASKLTNAPCDADSLACVDSLRSQCDADPQPNSLRLRFVCWAQDEGAIWQLAAIPSLHTLILGNASLPRTPKQDFSSTAMSTVRPWLLLYTRHVQNHPQCRTRHEHGYVGPLSTAEVHVPSACIACGLS